MKFCTNCGRQLSDDSRFCDRCGTPSPDPVRRDQAAGQSVYPPVNQPASSGRSRRWIPVAVAGGAVALIAAAVLLVSGIVSMLSVREDAPIRGVEQEHTVQVLPGTAESVPAGDVLPDPNETQSAEAMDQSTASYQICTQDCSIRNTNGDVLVTILYDQVVLDAGVPEFDAINDMIRADFDAFLAGISDIYETPAGEWEEMLASQGMPYGALTCTAAAEVVTNSGGILSIRYSTEWFMGGVFNADHYCMTFNLYTGRYLTLAELTGLEPEDLTRQLREAVCAYLEPQRDQLFGDPAEVLAQYELEDFQYYLQDGQIVLEFPTYTFGPGYMGSTTVYTGIYAEAVN